MGNPKVESLAVTRKDLWGVVDGALAILFLFQPQRKFIPVGLVRQYFQTKILKIARLDLRTIWKKNDGV